MRGIGDPREPAAFALVVLVGFVVAKFVSVAVHEVLGHGLFTELLGGTFYGVYVSPGSGFSLIFLPATTPAATKALVDLAGILVDLVLGLTVWAAYLRAHTFLGRLFGLLFVQVLVVYSLLYLALGAVEGTAGDSALAVAVLGAPHLTAAFLLVGLLWAVGSGYVISADLVRLAAPAMPLRRQIVYPALFWFAPVAVGVLPGLASASGSLLLYFVLFLGVGGATFAVATVLAARLGPPARPPVARPEGRLVPLVVAFVVVLPLWVGAFGLTDGVAHGLLLQEPPLQAERSLSSSQAINVRVELTGDRNVTLTFRMKALKPPNVSPLEDQVFASFEHRADFAYWEGAARYLSVGLMNVSSWTVASRSSINESATLWSGGGLAANPRIVVLGIRDPEERPRLVNVTTNGSRTFLTLTVFDPFRANRLPNPCAGCFLDEVNLTWPSGTPGSYRLVGVGASGGASTPLIGTDPGAGIEYARFRNLAVGDAPTTYVLALEAA